MSTDEIDSGSWVTWPSVRGTAMFVVLGTGMVDGAPTALIAPLFHIIAKEHAKIKNVLAPIADLSVGVRPIAMISGDAQ